MTAIQVKNVPDEVRDELAAAAKRAGQSLQAYVLGILEREARFARNVKKVAQCPIPGADVSTEDIVAAVREARCVQPPASCSSADGTA
ncbi:FitA-like ribbon-helix-helix domain-containing protein [Marinactinospora rubrisoli]|uniref:Antitoxin FitA-like ribbon-helix-helix domain-containing protein n=1 Tax=Marinactinospora rubrisoli TaxID=2715399 RepID=A0ABW2KMA5_9ACTN